MVLCRINHRPFPVRFQGGFGDLFDRVFESFPFQTFGEQGATATFPRMNFVENENAFLVEADVPGLTMDDLELFVQDNELTVQGERKQETAEGVTVHRQERVVGKFSRVLTLPTDVDADKVEAKLRSGVLTVTLPKAEAVLPRKIEVKS